MQNLFYKNIIKLLKENSDSIKELEKYKILKKDEIKHILEKSVSLEKAILLADYFNYPLDYLINQEVNFKPATPSSEIKFLVLDVDGVLTDAGMYYTENGDEFKKFNAKDGLAIKRLTNKGLRVGIISNGKNVKLIKNRAQLLGIEQVYVGKDEKTIVLDKWCKEFKINLSEVAYIGDDLNDINLMSKVGFTACPNDAVVEIRTAVNVILNTNGGNGCVREFCDTYLA